MSRISFLSFLYPDRCIVCDTVVPLGEYFCDNCKDSLTPISVKICKKCGRPTKKCDCSKYVYHFRGAAAPFYNEDAAQSAIYNYKMLPNVSSARYFAPIMAEYFIKHFSDVKIDCVTAVPMKLSKKIGTCFDHTAFLAKCTAKELNLPYKALLVEKGKRSPQHKLKAAERFKNVKGSYVGKKNNYENVLLIDDIKTTGATLDECARQLMLAGTENVYVLTAVIGS